MSPEQLETLRKLSLLFEEGSAGVNHVKQLSALLSEINQITDKQKEEIEQI